MPEIKALPTNYRGHRFRSRVEARWAVFFDHMGAFWEYEPEGYELKDGTCYLPDFRLHGHWFEVKGAEPTPEEIRKARMLAKESGGDVLVCFGSFSSGYRSVAHPVMVRLTSDGKLEGLLEWWHCSQCGKLEPVKVTAGCGSCACGYLYPSAQLTQAYAAARAARFGAHE